MRVETDRRRGDRWMVGDRLCAKKWSKVHLLNGTEKIERRALSPLYVPVWAFRRFEHALCLPWSQSAGGHVDEERETRDVLWGVVFGTIWGAVGVIFTLSPVQPFLRAWFMDFHGWSWPFI